MSFGQSRTEPLPITTYVEEGARIAAILLVWAVLGVVASALFSQTGGWLFQLLGAWLGYALGLTGALNAILYVVYRSIDYRSA